MIRNQNNFSNYKIVTLQLTLKLGINEMFCVLESSEGKKTFVFFALIDPTGLLTRHS